MPTQKTKIEMTLEELERELALLIPMSEPIRASDRIDAIIPPEHRRRVWRGLQRAGFKLPGLRLRWSVFSIATGLVLGLLYCLRYICGIGHTLSLRWSDLVFWQTG